MRQLQRHPLLLSWLNCAQHIADNFQADQEAVAAGKHDDWKNDPWNALAGIVALDQFSRNLHRNSPHAWANDAQALSWARHMLVRVMGTPLQEGGLRPYKVHGRRRLGLKEQTAATGSKLSSAVIRQAPDTCWCASWE